MAKFAEWLNAQVESNDGTNGDFLRAFLARYFRRRRREDGRFRIF